MDSLPERRLRNIMKIRGVRSAELAGAVGISIQTLRNLACGNHRSRKTRQRISNFLAANVWRDIRPETVLATLQPGAELTDLTRSPDEISAEFPKGSVTIVNQNKVRIIQPTDVILRRPAGGKGQEETRKVKNK